MILDELIRSHTYASLGERIARALAFLRESNHDALACGRHEIDGERLFALIDEYETRPLEQCAWEAHRRYIDVQFVASGIERMGWSPLSAMKVARDYDEQRDVAFFSPQTGFVANLGVRRADACEFLTVRVGMFAIFFPHDVHMPQVAAGAPGLVRKVVVKAAVG